MCKQPNNVSAVSMFGVLVWTYQWSHLSHHSYVVQVDEDNVECRRVVTASVTVRNGVMLLYSLHTKLVNTLQKHSSGIWNKHVQRTPHLLVYLIKTCSLTKRQWTTLVTPWYFWSGPRDTCGHQIVPTQIQLTIKSGESCRSVSTAGPYLT